MTLHRDKVFTNISPVLGCFSVQRPGNAQGPYNTTVDIVLHFFTSISRTVHGLSWTPPQTVHGLSKNASRTVHGRPTDGPRTAPRTAHRLPMDCPQTPDERFIDRRRMPHGLSMDTPRTFHGIAMDYPQTTHGRSTKCPRTVHEPSMRTTPWASLHALSLKCSCAPRRLAVCGLSTDAPRQTAHAHRPFDTAQTVRGLSTHTRRTVHEPPILFPSTVRGMSVDSPLIIHRRAKDCPRMVREKSSDFTRTVHAHRHTDTPRTLHGLFMGTPRQTVDSLSTDCLRMSHGLPTTVYAHNLMGTPRLPTDYPRPVNRLATAWPQTGHGLAMDTPRTVQGRSIDALRTVHGLSTECLQPPNEFPMDCP